MGVIEEIAAERRRQVNEEGWTAVHDDDEPPSGELAAAAGCYALKASTGGGDFGNTKVQMDRYRRGAAPKSWPWHDDEDVAMRGDTPVWRKVATWWKPKNPRRDLIRAGALIVAEIERLDRTRTARLAADQGDTSCK